jgi:hypothetical protein
VPVVELTRNSKRAGENGPPRGPEKVMLLAGITIGRLRQLGRLFFGASGRQQQHGKYAKKSERGACGHHGGATG